jgi:hypothetical protein
MGLRKAIRHEKCQFSPTSLRAPEWEVNSFIQMKKPLSGEKTWKRIRGMKLKGCDNAKMPDVLMSARSTKEMTWDPEALDKWLDQDPDA